MVLHEIETSRQQWEKPKLKISTQRPQAEEEKKTHNWNGEKPRENGEKEKKRNQLKKSKFQTRTKRWRNK